MLKEQPVHLLQLEQVSPSPHIPYLSSSPPHISPEHKKAIYAKNDDLHYRHYISKKWVLLICVIVYFSINLNGGTNNSMFSQQPLYVVRAATLRWISKRVRCVRKRNLRTSANVPYNDLVSQWLYKKDEAIKI
jgi:hypothetical protein